MITREDYYKDHVKTGANSDDLIQPADGLFPQDGILIGDFISCSDEDTHTAPALIPIANTNGVCFLTDKENDGEVKRVIQLMALRFASAVPAGKCKMILFDGQRFGQDLIHLAELDQNIKDGDVFTAVDEFKVKLKEVRKDIKDRIISTLGSKYQGKTLIEYNADAGEMSIPYILVVIADFPQRLDRECIELLRDIVATGRRAGVFVLMNLDTSYPLIQDASHSKLDISSFLDTSSDTSMCVIYRADGRYYIKNLANDSDKSIEMFLNRFTLRLDSFIPENIDEIKDYLKTRVSARQSAKIDISNLFTEDNFWTESSADGISIPIGKINDSTIQYFKLGFDSVHAKVGGTTNTGKSVVLHNIIANGAWLYSPDELQFILMDFKDGIGFKPYEKLPHTRILSVVNEPAYAQTVFDYVLLEASRRNAIFGSCGVDNFTDYKALNKAAMPRLLVIIDEFTSMYYNTSSQGARDLNSRIDQIGRTVRSAGINMIICTQGLRNLDVDLSQFTLGIGLRFQSDRDRRFISSEFQFPKGMGQGDAFYCDNDSFVRFRVAYMKNDLKNRQMLVDKRIADINSHDKDYEPFERFIYSGKQQINFVPANNPQSIVIGCPLLSHTPIEFSFDRENGANLLIVGQRCVSSISIVYHTLLQILRSQQEKMVYIFDKSPLGCEELRRVSNEYSSICKYDTEDDNISNLLKQAETTLINRNKERKEWTKTVFICIYDTFNYGKGKISDDGRYPEDYYSLMRLLKDGPNNGIHLIVFSDSYNHYERSFGSSSLGEWKTKIALLGDDSYKIFSLRNNAYTYVEDSVNAAIIDCGGESTPIEIETYKI